MANTPPPLGYSTPLIPESQDELYQQQVADKAITLTKSALHQYLESFLNPTGQNRRYLGATFSPEGLQYVTELTFDEEMKADPNKRKTYLARFFAENTGRLPSVLLIDQGLESAKQGLTPLESGFSLNSQWHATISYHAKVSMSVLVATYSEEDTTTLSGALFYILDTLPSVVNNRIIYNVGNQWELRFPIAPLTAGQLTNLTVEGDSKSQVWTRSIEISFDFETISTFKMPHAKIVPPTIISYGDTDGPQPRILNLVPNQSIPLGMGYPLMIEGMQIKHSLGTSDPNIALISSAPPWKIQPIRQGKALLYVFDGKRSPERDPVTGQKKNVIIDIPFKITL